MPDGAGYVELKADPWGDVDTRALPATLQLRVRVGGERVVRAGVHRDVKSVLREAGLPAWLRELVPFIYAPRDAGAGDAGSLIAIGDLWIDERLRPRKPGAGCGRFIWQPR